MKNINQRDTLFAELAISTKPNEEDGQGERAVQNQDV